MTKPNSIIVIDQRKQLKTCDFYDTKCGIIEPAC